MRKDARTRRASRSPAQVGATVGGVETKANVATTTPEETIKDAVAMTTWTILIEELSSTMDALSGRIAEKSRATSK